MALGWQSGMETGAPVLDAQHRALVERAAALVGAIEAGGDRATVERAMRDFGDYSVRFFSSEQDCILRGQCPAIQWNGNARAELIKIMADFRQSYERGGSAPSLAEDLSDRLCEWVGRYVPGPDASTLPCVRTPRQAVR